MAMSPKKIPADLSFTRTEYSCVVSIKGVEFLNQNILDCVIRENIFDIIPTIYLTIQDNGLFLENYPLEDNDVIKISVSRSSVTAPVLNMEFLLNDYEVINKDGDKINSCIIKMTGYLKNNKTFEPIQTRSFSNQTSVDVFASLASEMGFALDSRVKTSDNMNWIQASQNNYSFLHDVLKRSFKPDDAISLGVTRNSKMIITSLDTVQNSKITKNAVFDQEATISNAIDGGDTIFYNSYNIMNAMGSNNKKGAYSAQFGHYDLEKIVAGVIDFTKNKMSKYSYKDKTKTKDITFNLIPAVLNNKNMHANYYKAMATNVHYNMDFFKNLLLLHINPNKDVNIFDKVNINMPSMIGVEKTNTTVSGEYIVGGIVYQLNLDGLFRSSLLCFRSGYNPSSVMKSNEFSGV